MAPTLPVCKSVTAIIFGAALVVFAVTLTWSGHPTVLSRRRRSTYLAGVESAELLSEAWVQSPEFEDVLHLDVDAASTVSSLRQKCLRPWRSFADGQKAQLACQEWARREWPGNGVVVYTCSSHAGQSCGGLADRVRGMLFMYWLAVLRKAAFFVDYQRPTNHRLESFWRPNNVNWTLPEARRETDSMVEERERGGQQTFHGGNGCAPPLFDRNIDHGCQCLRTYLATKDIESAKVLRFATTHHLRCMSMLFRNTLNMEFTHGQWATTSSYLFRTTPLLKSMSRKFMKSTQWSPKNSVCLHIRSGGPIGPVGYEMVDNVRTPPASRQTMYQCAASFSKQKLHPAKHVKVPVISNPSTYLIIADHDELVEEARRSLNQTKARILSTTSMGPMLHIDKVSNDLMSDRSLKEQVHRGERRAYFDHYLLSLCQYVIVDSSGFAWTALNYSPQDRIVLRPSAKDKGCHEAEETRHL